MFVENSRREIPYPDEVPLNASRRCDCIEVPELSLSAPSKAATYRVTSRDVQVYALASLGAWILSLIDLGANGYVCGRDMRRMDEPYESDRIVQITGVGNHQITDIHVGSSVES